MNLHDAPLTAAVQKHHRAVKNRTVEFFVISGITIGALAFGYVPNAAVISLLSGVLLITGYRQRRSAKLMSGACQAISKKNTDEIDRISKDIQDRYATQASAT